MQSNSWQRLRLFLLILLSDQSTPAATREAAYQLLLDLAPLLPGGQA